MSEITAAIEARHAQISRLQSDIETLQRAASIMDGKGTTAKAGPGRPKAKAASGQPKTKQKRSTWSAADRKVISKRMKAYWAKRRSAKQ